MSVDLVIRILRNQSAFSSRMSYAALRLVVTSLSTSSGADRDEQVVHVKAHAALELSVLAVHDVDALVSVHTLKTVFEKCTVDFLVPAMS